MKVRTGRLIVCYNVAFHSSSGQTRCCTELSQGTADSHWQRSRSSKPLHLLSRSLVTLHLCWFWTWKTFEKGKASFSPLSLPHSFTVCPCQFPLRVTPHIQAYANAKCQGETTWLSLAWSEENLLGRHQWGTVSRSRITAITQACTGLTLGQRLLLCSLGVTYTKSTNFTGGKEVKQQTRIGCKAFLRLDSAVRKELVRELSEGQQGSLPSPNTQPCLICSSGIFKGKETWTHVLPHTNKLQYLQTSWDFSDP